MLAEIPLVQLFLFYLKTAASLRKGREVAGGAFDALGLQVVVMAEDNLVGACGLEGDVPAALCDGGCVDRQEQTRGEEEYFVHAVPLFVAACAVLLVLYIEPCLPVVALAAETALVDLAHLHLVGALRHLKNLVMAAGAFQPLPGNVFLMAENYLRSVLR